MDSKRRAFIKQFLRFNYIGILTIIVGSGVFILLIKMEINYVMALAGDYLAGIFFSYYMNKKFTFQVKVDNDVPKLIKTFVMYIISFSLNVALLKLCSEYYGFDMIYSQIVLIFVLAVFNFFVYKLLIFGVADERKSV